MLREVLARFGIDFDGAQLLTGINSLRELGTAALGVVRDIGVFLVEALEEAVLGTIALGVEAARTATTLGLSTQAVQEWGFAASRAGLGVEEVADAMSTLQERARDALLDPASDPAEQLRLLGVAARGANGELRSGEDLFLAVADGLAGMGTQTERVGAAMTLFGDVGRDLLPVLQDGSAGIEELRQRARDLGGGLSGEVAANAAKATRAMADFEFAMTGLRSVMVSDIIPVITVLTTGVADLIGFFNRMTRGTRPLRAILLLLATAIGSVAAVILLAMLPVLPPLIIQMALLTAAFAIWAAVIAVVVLAVDDLLTLFAGGDSVIGRFLDAMFGAGAAKTVAIELQRAWASVVEWLIKVGRPAFMRFGRFLVSLWPLIRPGLRALGRFIIQTFDFVRTLPARVQAFIKPIRVFFSSLDAQATAFFESIAQRFAALREQAAGVLGFFGIDVAGGPAAAGAPGATGAPGAVPGAPGATVRPEGAKTTNVEQTNQININGSNLSPEVLQARVTAAIADVNQRALRVAERALTTIAPTPAGG